MIIYSGDLPETLEQVQIHAFNHSPLLSLEDWVILPLKPLNIMFHFYISKTSMDLLHGVRQLTLFKNSYAAG